MGEGWRSITGWVDYEVSNLGNVRRATDRWVTGGTGGRYLRWPKGRLLGKRYSSAGYLTVLFPTGDPKDRKFKNVSVHVLVCTAFHGPAPTPAHEVAHWDGDRGNARADNVRWATRAENIEDKIRHGRTDRGTKHRSSKLTEDQVREIRSALAGGSSARALGRTYSVTHQAIQEIRSGRCWGWLV